MKSIKDYRTSLTDLLKLCAYYQLSEEETRRYVADLMAMYFEATFERTVQRQSDRWDAKMASALEKLPIWQMHA